MLVLTRKPDEEIVIDIPPSSTPTRITLQVLDVRGKGDPTGGARTRLGITAPRYVIVHRKEIADRIESERE